MLTRGGDPFCKLVFFTYILSPIEIVKHSWPYLPATRTFCTKAERRTLVLRIYILQQIRKLFAHPDIHTGYRLSELVDQLKVR